MAKAIALGNPKFVKIEVYDKALNSAKQIETRAIHSTFHAPAIIIPKAK
jgi:hypothetical protein